VAATTRATELQQHNGVLLAQLDSLASSAQRFQDEFVSRAADATATVRHSPWPFFP
jgi:hypothetical protein